MTQLGGTMCVLKINMIRHTKINLKKRMREVQKKSGRSPTERDCQRYDFALFITLRGQFGSWNGGKRALGYKTTEMHERISKDKLASDLRRWVSKEKCHPWGDREKEFGHSYRLYVRRFGSIANAYKKAGIVNKNVGYRIV